MLVDKIRLLSGKENYFKGMGMFLEVGPACSINL